MADTSRGRLAYVAEGASTPGVTPTNPDFQILRFTSSGLAYTKQTTESNELESGAMITDLIETGAESGGNMDVEWSPDTYDDLVEAALRGTRTTAVASAAGDAAIAASGGTATVTDTGAFADATVGQFLLFRGWSNPTNNGWKQVATNADDDTITVEDATMVAESAGGSGQIDGQMIRNGTEERSFSLEETFTDIDVFRLFKGQRVGMMSADFSAGSILTGSIGFMGLGVEIEDSSPPSWLGTGSRTTATTTGVMNATANVGGIYVDGALSTACFKSLSLNLENQLRPTQCIGSKFPGLVGYGRQRVSGSLTKVFNSIALYEAMLNHSDISLAFGAYNTDGGIHFYLPRVKLGSDNVGLSGGNDTDVDESIDWTAIKNTAGTHQIQVCIAS